MGPDWLQRRACVCSTTATAATTAAATAEKVCSGRSATAGSSTADSLPRPSYAANGECPSRVWVSAAAAAAAAAAGHDAGKSWHQPRSNQQRNSRTSTGETILDSNTCPSKQCNCMERLKFDINQSIYLFVPLSRAIFVRVCRCGSRIFCRGGGQRRPCTAGAFGARADGGLGLINIRLRYIVSIEYSERFFFFFFAIVKKFVEKNIGGREQGGVMTHNPPPPPLGSAPGML